MTTNLQDMTTNPILKQPFKPVLKRIAIVLFVCVSILSTAASCSLNPFSKAMVLGVIKQESGKNTFSKINSVKAISGKNDNEGLTNLPVIKTFQASKDVLFIQTEKAVFKTSDGGKNWQRIYIFPVIYSEDKAKAKEITDQLNKNNDVLMQDFWVNSDNLNNIYFAIKYQNTGKIFKTSDGGKTVQEVYSSDEATSVSYVVIDPSDENHIYALLNQNALIQSKDAGQTWQKISEKALETDKIVQIGILSDNKTFFVLYGKLGIFVSPNGAKWQKLILRKNTTKENATKTKSSAMTLVQNLQERTQKALDDTQQRLAPETAKPFETYSKVIFGNPTSDGQPNKSAIVIADKEIWVTTDITTKPLAQITNIPTQDTKSEIRDVAVDTKNSLTSEFNTVYVAIENRLWVSQNNGETWANKKLGLENLGYINKITIDSTDNDVIYLSLTNKK